MILDYLASKRICSSDLVVVSPDVGGVARARAFAKKLSDAPLAIVDKRRHGHNVAEVILHYTLAIITWWKVLSLELGEICTKYICTEFRNL